jgi:phosphoesterase RecJ-like protein
LVSAHVHLEGDALGAELALARLLRWLGHKAYVVNDDAVPKEYGFLPDLKTIRRGPRLPPYDVAVLVDCSDVSRAGSIAGLLKKDKPVWNIDHHGSNSRFGEVRWIDGKASSASEMIYRLYKALGVPIGRKEAVLLYTGISTDTGSFRYATTSAETHAATADLLRHPVDVYGIHRALRENMPLETVRAIGKVVSEIRCDKTGKVVWLQASASLLKKYPDLIDKTDDLVGWARSVRGAHIAILFKEVRPGEVRINFRSRSRANVDRLARLFGGGGHPMASGCTVRLSLRETVRRVVAAAVAATAQRCS